MNTNCFYLIDKPKGITSFDVLRKLKKILNIKKMGHTGTLDPGATGLLLVAVGEYTKLIPYFEKDTKEYEFKIHLNGTSPSFDADSQITYISQEQQEYFKINLHQTHIHNILQSHFTGKILQMPPKYSALKIGGKKAIDMVRNGQDFELQAREVIIYKREILKYHYPELYLKAKVSAGTYIRSIAQDLGNMLSTGGYTTFLRRTMIGNLTLQYAQILDNFDPLQKLSDEDIFSKDDFIQLYENELNDLNNGKIIKNNLLSLEDQKTYFVKNENFITNIVKVNGEYIIPMRKI